jgi:hypothetical protein
MLADLKHKTLVNSFLEQYAGQVLLSIRVALPDRTKTSSSDEPPANQLDWSSKSGTQQIVTNGTLCSASIVVEKRPLITLALPCGSSNWSACTSKTRPEPSRPTLL